MTAIEDRGLWVIIPAFNEEATIGGVVRGVREELEEWGVDYQVVVVNDGSRDGTGRSAEKAGARVVSHFVNRGLGAALGTGLAVARGRRAEVVVTFDGDGQHDPRDIRRVVEPILKGKAEVVVGSRLLRSEGMPVDRWMINWVGNLGAWLFFGALTTDSQSGLRAFGKRAVEQINIRTERMEVAFEFFGEIKRLGLCYAEVSIRPIYTDYSRNKGQEGRGNLNAVFVLAKLLLRLAR